MSKDKHWEVIAKMYSCPECGWVTECQPNCPTQPTAEQCPCFNFGTCPTDGKHRDE